jgi:hypothetical protein
MAADGEEGAEESLAVPWLGADAGAQRSKGNECAAKRARAIEERRRYLKWVGGDGESRRRQERVDKDGPR